MNSQPSQPSPRLSPSETDNLQLRTVNFYESPVTSHKSRLFIRLPPLELSCLSFSCPRPLFSIGCSLFCENTGGGIPLRDSVPSAISVNSAVSHAPAGLSPSETNNLQLQTVDSWPSQSSPCRSPSETNNLQLQTVNIHKSQAISHVSLSPLDSALTRTARLCTILVQISPLDSALTDTLPVSPLKSALTKTPRGVAPLSIQLCVLCASVANHFSPRAVSAYPDLHESQVNSHKSRPARLRHRRGGFGNRKP